MQTLITKLKTSVNNSSLLKIGELRISFTPLTEVKSMGVVSATSKTLTIIGTGYFTNSAGSSNLGQTVDNSGADVYMSVGTSCVSVSNKYIVTVLYLANLNGVSINGAEFMTLLSSFNYPNNGVNCSFDLNKLAQSMGLTSIQAIKSGISGKLSTFSNKTLLTLLKLDTDIITGTLSDISALVNLTNLDLASTSVTGDISYLINLTKLTTLSLYGTSCIGNVSSLGSLKLLTNLVLQGSGITGEITTMLDSMRANGRVSGVLTMTLGSTAITVNGSVVSIVKTATFTSEGYTIS